MWRGSQSRLVNGHLYRVLYQFCHLPSFLELRVLCLGLAPQPFLPISSCPLSNAQTLKLVGALSLDLPCVERIFLGKGRHKKTLFLGDLSQIWVGGGADSQTFGDIYQPLFFQISQIKITNSGRTKIHLLCSQISQKPWDGWVGKHIWERSPKKKRFFTPSLIFLSQFHL